MKPLRTATLSILVLTCTNYFSGEAAPPPKIAETITIKPNRLGKITADSPTVIKWINLSDDLDCIPDSNGKSAILLSPTPGKYKIAVYTADKDGASEPSYCTVVVEGPPKPPTPDPVPVPDNPLTKVFQADFTADTGINKAAELVALTAIYNNASLLLTQPSITTVGELFTAVQTARRVKVPDTSLVNLRGKVGAELTAALGTDASVLLSDEVKAKAKTVFAKVGTALSGVK